MSDDGSPAKHGRPSYPLTSKERTYVATGDPGSYRESEMEKRVQKKIDDLGQRVNHLLSDIQLLAYNGYLEDEHWGDIWRDFIGFGDTDFLPRTDRRVPPKFEDSDEEPDHSDLIDACTVSPTPGRARPTSSPEQVAIQVGAMLQRLMLYPEGVDERQMAMEIAWGLAEGFLRHDMPAFSVMGDGRRDLKEEFIEYQQKRLDREAELDEKRLDQHEKNRDRSQEWTDARNEMAWYIRDILYDAGLPIQAKFGESDGMNEQLDDYHDEVCEDGIYAHEALDHVIDHLVEEPEDIDDDPLRSNVKGSAGQWVLFQEQYGPVEEFDPKEVVDEDDVLTVVSENHLVAKGKLSVLVEEDVQAIEDAHWKNVEATDVIETIVQQDGKPRSADIAEEIGERNDKAAVTKLCTDLAGREFERGILKGDNTGWELTPYGEVIAEEEFGYFFGPSGGVQSGAEEAALIDAAAAQIGIEDWQYSRKD